ncbi:MAG: response regulator transcription factor [Chloroflexi bacterium]|nr:response regulator transcription factor [Chloroflexota bacterium]
MTQQRFPPEANGNRTGPEPGRGPDELIRVLLVGEKWDSLRLALGALADAGRMTFAGPVVENIREALAETPPSLLLVGPDYGYDGAARLGRTYELQGHRFPVLLCVTHEDLEEVEAIYEDADDILVVPCTTAELGKRIRRLTVQRGHSAASHLLHVGTVVLDLSTYHVTADGRPVSLAWMEFKLLKFLMQNSGRVFTREHLLAKVWETHAFVGARTVDVHIRRLRHKLGAPGEALFRTVKNIGYGLVEPR